MGFIIDNNKDPMRDNRDSTRRITSLAEAVEGVSREKESCVRPATAANCRSCINKLKAWLGDSYSTLPLSGLTRERVDELAAWLRVLHPDKPQTAEFYLRTLRAMYRHALRKYPSAALEGDPFEGCRTGRRYLSRRAADRESVARLRSTALRAGLAPCLRQTLDVLLFMLYARGVVFHDVYNLTWGMVEGGHIRYLRNKTGVPIDTELSAETLAIMERYRRDSSAYVFPFLHEARRGVSRELSEKASLRRVNRDAKRIARAAGLSLALTTYVMRHTFASLMLEAGKQSQSSVRCPKSFFKWILVRALKYTSRSLSPLPNTTHCRS